MNSELQVLSENELHQVSAAHGTGFWGKIAALHVAVGVVEFYNIAARFAIKGCTDIEEGDYFSSHICFAKDKISDLSHGILNHNHTDSVKTEL
jgi:hypothetical protein